MMSTDDKSLDISFLYMIINVDFICHVLVGATRRILCGPPKIREAKTEFVRTIRISKGEETENHLIASKQPSSKDGGIFFTE